MKKFIYSAVLFLLVIGVCCGALVVGAFLIERNAYKRQVALAEKASLLVVADSHLACSVDPGFWDEAVNFSCNGTGVDTWLIKLKSLAAFGALQNKWVIVDVCPRYILQCDRDKGVEDMAFLRLSLVKDLTLREACESAFSLAENFIGGATERYSSALYDCLRGRAARSLVAGGYERLAPNNNFLARLEAEHRQVDALPVSALSTSLPPIGDHPVVQGIKELIDFVSEQPAHVLLVITPLHPLERERLSKRTELTYFYSAVTNIINDKKAPVLDYAAMPFPDECWKDTTHLNCKGAEIFTKQLKSDFETKVLKNKW